MPRHHLDSHLVDAILRLVGGVFFTTCDIAGPQAAAVAVERLRSSAMLTRTIMIATRYVMLWPTCKRMRYTPKIMTLGSQ